MDNNIQFDVIVGATNENKHQVKTLCDGLGHFHFHSQVDNISEFMYHADLAIVQVAPQLGRDVLWDYHQ